MIKLPTKLIQTFINDLVRIEGGPIYIWNTSSSDKKYKSINIFGACVFSNKEKNTYMYYICLIDFLHIKCISTEKITSLVCRYKHKVILIENIYKPT